MLDHLGIGVMDLEGSRRFYEEALAPLGFRQIMTADRAIPMASTSKLSAENLKNKNYLSPSRKDTKKIKNSLA